MTSIGAVQLDGPDIGAVESTPSGGSTITKVADDTVSVVEAKNRSITSVINKVVNATVSIPDSETVFRAIIRVVDDSITVAEDVVDTRTLVRVANETVNIGESVLNTGVAGFVNQAEIIAAGSDNLQGMEGAVLKMEIEGEPGGTWDFGSESAPGIELTVSSRSWTTSGVETTKTRTVIAAPDADNATGALMRQEAPNQTSKEETDNGDSTTVYIVLSDWIYATDTITDFTILADTFTDDGAGGSTDGNTLQSGIAVANNSTLDYPLPVPQFLNTQLEWVESSTYHVEMFVSHPYYESGKPVQAVKFTVSDGTNTATATVSTLTTSTIVTESGLSVPVFAADISITGLTQGVMCTTDAVVYPFVGDEFTVSTDADSWPSPNLTELQWLNDRTGGYGKVYAYVDPSSGDDGTGVASTTVGTAQASPFLTIAGAANDAQTENNTSNSRNNLSGCIIRLETGDTDQFGSGLDSRTDGDLPLIVEAADAADKATTKIIANATGDDDINNKLRLRNITLDLQSAGDIFLDGAQASSLPITTYLMVDNCTVDTANGTLVVVYRVGYVEYNNCDGEGPGPGVEGFGTTNMAVAKIVGCDWTRALQVSTGKFDAVHNIIGSIIKTDGRVETRGGAVANNTTAKGNLIAYSLLIAKNTACLTFPTSTEPRGSAVVGTIVVNASSTAPGQALLLAGDTDTTATENVQLIHSTITGQRVNWLYNDVSGTYTLKRGYVRGVLADQYNTKSDVFTNNANNVGNWTQIFHVGHKNNNLASDAGGSLTGVGNWLGEIMGLGSEHGSFSFIDDQGNSDTFDEGDYTPDTYNGPTLVAADAPYPFDLHGNTVWQYSGAVQSDTSTITKVVDETVSVVEAKNRSLTITKVDSDTVTVSEVALRVLALTRVLDDSITISDVALATLALTRVVDESITVVESALKSLALTRVSDDSVSVVEGVLQTLTLVKVASDSVTISESALTSQALVRVASDSVAVADGALKTLALTRVSDDLVSVSEAVSKVMALLRVVNESLTISEAALHVRQLTRVSDDTVSIVEDANQAISSALIKVVDDLVSISEATAKTLTLTKIVDETVTISESTLHLMALTRIVSESVSIPEAALKVAALTRISTDSVSISDAALRVLALTRNSNETVSVTDVALAQLGLVKIIGDSVTISENADALVINSVAKVADDVVGISGSALAVLTVVSTGPPPTGYETLSNTVRRRFQALIETPLGIPVIYANENEAPPKDGSPYVEFSVRHENTTMTAFGSENRFRMEGVGRVVVRSPIHRGDRELRSVAKTVIEGMRHTVFDGVVYQSCRMGQGGDRIAEDTGIPVPWDGSYSLEVLVPFHTDICEQAPARVLATTTLDPITVGSILRGFFHTNVTLAESLPTQFDNAPFSQPSGQMWARLSVQEIGSQTVEGGPMHRTRLRGLLTAQLFAPIGQGEQAQLAAADTIAGLFRATVIDGILCGAPKVRSLGRFGGDKWWQVNVSCPFSYDTI